MSERNYERVRRDNLIELIKQHGGQAKVADRMDVSTSYISQMVNGHSAIGNRSARNIERTFGLREGQLDEAPELVVANVGEPIESYGEPWVSVKSFTNRADAGLAIPDESGIQVPGGFIFKRASLRKAGLEQNDLSCIFARGHSMEPTISDGDLLLLNHDMTRVTDGAVFAIRWGADLRCKRLFRQPDGRISVRSDHPDKTRFPDEVIAEDDAGFEVIAHVCWRGGWV